MSDRYDINKWKENSTKNLLIWGYFMGGYELPGWRLKETRPWEEVKTETVVQYYWENRADKDEQIKIDIIECRSWLYAQDQLLALLKQHMRIQLSEARTKEIPVGDIAYAGEGQEPQHLLLVRANMVAVLNSIGKKKVPVAKTALQLDNIFYDKPLLRVTGVTPLIRQFFSEKKARKINEQTAAEVIIEASDPLQRPLWYKLMATSGEISIENDIPQVLFAEGERNQLTVYVSNENGDTAEGTTEL